jgi:O-antigen/teichoic acid export membrane protein
MQARISRPEFREGMRSLPEILRFGLRVTPGSLAEGASNETATWTLGLLASLGEIGAYSRAWTLTRRLNEINWRIAEMLFPTLVQRHSEGDKHGFDGVLVDTLRYASVGMLLVAAAGGGASASVMDLFGPGFGRGAGALAVLLIIPALATMSTSANAAHMARERPFLTTQIAVLRLLVILVAVPLLTIEFGITGTALGLLVGYLVDNAVQLWIIRGYLATPLRRIWRPREVTGLLAACATGFGASRLVDTFLPGLTGLVPAILAGSLVYAATYLWIAGLAPQDVRRVANFEARFGHRIPGRRRSRV